VITASITVTSENLPAGLMAKTTGRIDSIFVSEKQLVKKGDIIALIENPARFEDVMSIKNYELKIKTIDSLSVFAPSCSFFSSCLHVYRLGELQPAYQAFSKALEDYRYFTQTDYHNKKIAVIKKQIKTQNLILQKTQNQLELVKKQLDAAGQIFRIDSNLYVQKVLANAEFQHSKNTYLQHLQSFENAKLSIDHQNMNILQSEQAIFDLEQQRDEQNNQFKMALNNAYEQLQTQIKIWEQNYLLISPTDGVVTFTRYWQHNQNIVAGEVLATVVPQHKTKIIGKIELPPRGAGKVKEGQFVNVKFDNYPYMEYGMIKVQIAHISLVPINKDNQKNYVLEVVFPDLLVTNYGKTLEFSQEMTGSAEIITEDLRLLDKFLNPIKAVIKK